MFGLTPDQSFIVGVGSLWVFSAGVGAMEPPGPTSGPFYKWAFKFLKALSGDLGSVFAKYIPTPVVQQTTTTAQLTTTTVEGNPKP